MRSQASPRFAVANASAIEELDINPLIVCAEGQGAWIADALLVISEAAAIPSMHRETGAHLPAQSFG